MGSTFACNVTARSRVKRRVLAGAGLGLGFTLGATASAQAVTFQVNSGTDAGDGTCDVAPGVREEAGGGSATA
jgi:hypothetical protein